MSWKIQRRGTDGQLFAKQNVPESKVRGILPEAVIREMKLGRYTGDKHKRPHAVYSYEQDKPIKYNV